ncbi:PREDICTED: cytochrome P450 94B3-like [Fragaria vesca subsp. vesca]|uniref:cytochrome P450 94B3-like n=1 Tax=Fragaria vesca subsp. vesca TaxID=101020 RepID=UPI0002C2E8D7|nr:PREDICTED: cytochrome P450 94B3-like [Fragaria vesca subsp. vesca]
MEILFSLQFFLCLAFLSISVYLHFYTTRPKKSTNIGFKNYPILGSLPEFLKNRHRFLDWTTEILRNCPTNTAVFFSPGKVHAIVTANPLNVEHILQINFENYPKGERVISLFNDFLGDGIFNADGELWKVQRKTASYAFNIKSLRNFVMDNVSFEIETRLVPLLVRASDTGCRLDLQDVLERFAFDNICKMASNVDPGCLGGDGKSAAEFIRAFDDAATLCSGRFFYAFQFILMFKKLFNIGSEKRLRESIEIVHNYADKIIRSRMENNSYKQQEDLLSRFIENDNNNSPEFLRDIIISMILAGRDTTSSALSWFFFLLSSRASVQLNILNELEAIRARNGKRMGHTYGFDELKDMHYLQAAILEAMRLYPPVPVDSKQCINDDVMPDGTVLKKGWFVTYHAYAMGRMETIWGKDCREYVPERWIGEDGTCQQESAFKYPVFHAGPRMCLGKDLAFIQMKSIAASVIVRFEVDVEDKDTSPAHLLSMTLRIKGGLAVSVRKRCI